MNAPTGLQDLPEEILQLVTQYLPDRRDVLTLSEASKGLNHVIKQDSHLWLRWTRQDFPAIELELDGRTGRELFLSLKRPHIILTLLPFRWRIAVNLVDIAIKKLVPFRHGSEVAILTHQGDLYGWKLDEVLDNIQSGSSTISVTRAQFDKYGLRHLPMVDEPIVDVDVRPPHGIHGVLTSSGLVLYCIVVEVDSGLIPIRYSGKYISKVMDQAFRFPESIAEEDIISNNVSHILGAPAWSFGPAEYVTEDKDGQSFYTCGSRSIVSRQPVKVTAFDDYVKSAPGGRLKIGSDVLITQGFDLIHKRRDQTIVSQHLRLQPRPSVRDLEHICLDFTNDEEPFHLIPGGYGIFFAIQRKDSFVCCTSARRRPGIDRSIWCPDTQFDGRLLGMTCTRPAPSEHPPRRQGWRIIFRDENKVYQIEFRNPTMDYREPPLPLGTAMNPVQFEFPLIKSEPVRVPALDDCHVIDASWVSLAGSWGWVALGHPKASVGERSDVSENQKIGVPDGRPCKRYRYDGPSTSWSEVAKSPIRTLSAWWKLRR